MAENRIILIAGPNGAGKTTFINADLIAAGLSPFAPELAARRAGRLMLKEIDRCATEGINQGGHAIPPPPRLKEWSTPENEEAFADL